MQSANIAPDLSDALTAWQRSNIPMNEEEAFGMIANLWLVTKHKNVSDADYELMISTYAAKISKFPRQVVMDVFADWTDCDDGEWFPALKGLTDLLKAKKVHHDNLGKALGEWGSKEHIQKRINSLKIQLERVVNRREPPVGADVPEKYKVLRGRDLQSATPYFERFVAKRVARLEALL